MEFNKHLFECKISFLGTLDIMALQLVASFQENSFENSKMKKKMNSFVQMV